MRDWSLASLAGLGSALLLAGALFFQYVIHLYPCELCILQRWPHLVAVILGLVVWFVPSATVMALGALAVATSGVIGIYHTGVERQWWAGPSACSGTTDITQMNAQQMMDAIMAAPVIRCGDVQWEMLGLSMASWNAIFSFALAGVWLVAMRRA